MKLYLRTFGCRANSYDSEAVMASAAAGGYGLVDDAAAADVAVFNSCAVTSEAERDVRKAVRRAAASNPRLRSIVMGCSAALPASARGLGQLPTVDRVVAGGDIAAVAAALGVPAARGTSRQGSARAVLRVQDGCDEHCTFCATTMARGANRSRPAHVLAEEARTLAVAHPEIVITGTHIGTWGADIGSSLGVLMQSLVRAVPDARFRLSSIEATEVDGALCELMAGDPRRLAPHLHAPLQSGSDRVLKRMGRHWYTAASYSAAIERLAPRLPHFGLGADIIVGFPGETDDDFEDTVRIVERLPFTYLHVFTYSERAGTAALRLPGRVDGATSRDRSARLRDMADQRAAAHARARVGTAADVVVTAGAPHRTGVTEDYLTVRVAGDVARGTRLDLDLTRDSFLERTTGS